MLGVLLGTPFAENDGIDSPFSCQEKRSPTMTALNSLVTNQLRKKVQQVRSVSFTPFPQRHRSPRGSFLASAMDITLVQVLTQFDSNPKITFSRAIRLAVTSW
jgi:hypothetical protein